MTMIYWVLVDWCFYIWVDGFRVYGRPPVWELASPKMPFMYFAKAILFASSLAWFTGGLL